MKILMIILQFIFVPLVSPLCFGIINKIKARLQNRQGARIIQPYYDLWKLLHKDEVISRDASWIFRYAPFIVFSVTLLVGASIPLFSVCSQNAPTGDLLLIVYTLAIGTFFLALAGMDVGSAFGGFGSSREVTVAALAEGGFIFSLFTVALVSGTTDVFAASRGCMMAYGSALMPLGLAFVGFFIVMLAETTRFPFDNPSTHLELTMINEAMLLEYSGKRLALMEWAASNKFMIFAALGANLFFPWGIAQNFAPVAVCIGVLALLVKMFICCGAVAVIESTMAKYRFFRLPDLLMVSFVFSVVAISLIR